MTSQQTQYMQLAIRLAKRGLYTTDPNPRVACVIVKDDEVVGQGWHQRYGQAHAEVLAIEDAGSKAKGATAYVTLEPCNHTGKTPPCVDALIEAGITEVIVAMQDPNPLVSGEGLVRLRASGINVSCGLLESQAKALNPGFIKRMETGLPYVRVKLAMSLDGRTAMASGESLWITGEAARADVQKLRARASVIMTGINTVLTDDPSLNVRLSAQDLGIEGVVNQPLRVVLDSHSQFPDDAKMRACDGDIIVYTAEIDDVSKKDQQQRQCQFISIEKSGKGLDLVKVLKDLAGREANEIHIEAGSTLCGAMLEQQLVDEIVIYMAPHIMGNGARGLFALPGLTQMKDKINMAIKDVRKVGQDMRITMLPVYETK